MSRVPYLRLVSPDEPSAVGETPRTPVEPVLTLAEHAHQVVDKVRDMVADSVEFAARHKGPVGVLVVAAGALLFSRKRKRS